MLQRLLTCLLFFLLFRLIVFQATAQTAVLYRVKIDSIQTLINHQIKADTNTVKRLNYLGMLCTYDMQYKRGLVAIAAARQLAQKLHYNKGEGFYRRALNRFNYFSLLGYYYYHFLAKWSYTDRKRNEEIDQLDVRPPDNTSNPRAKAEIWDAVNYFEKHPNREILGNLLTVYADYLEPDEKIRYLDKAAHLFQDDHKPAPVFFIEMEEMALYEESGKTPEAKTAEIKARTILLNTKDSREKALMYYMSAQRYTQQRRNDLSYEFALQADQLLEKLGEKDLRLEVLYRLGIISADLSLFRKAVGYFKKAVILSGENANNAAAYLTDLSLQTAFSLISLKEFDEARVFIDKAKNAPDNLHSAEIKKYNIARRYDAMGQLLMGQGKYQEALTSFSQSLSFSRQTSDSTRLASYMTLYIAQCYQKLGQISESIRYAKISYDKASPRQKDSPQATFITLKASLLLSEVFEDADNPQEAYKYLKVYQKLRKEADQKDEANHLLDVEIRSAIEKSEQEKQSQGQRILAIEKQSEIDGLKAQAEKQLLQSKADQAELDKKLEKQRLEAKAAQNKRQQDYQISLLNLDIDNQHKIRTGLLGGLVLFAFFVILLTRQNRVKQRFNKLLTNQKEEIENQRDQLNLTLTELKTTQVQLIQKEKLASLGELTAGIAHEIQNPLNFVNNFSEVSSDLVEELKEEALAGNTDDVLAIADDLNQNLKKISHHGGRASSIVKGMLEHSRLGTGEKQPTDLNALCNEYLRLAYHGLLVKDKSFKADLKTDFDPKLEMVDVVPQEIGRVLLNLYNNAFYAVKERGALGEGQGVDYQPTVWVSTKQFDNQVEIRVRDNGAGIPESVKAKIFQPFFTTKPTGEGTGLGLSLSYDIITKGHGGTLTLQSLEGNKTEFVIQFPAE